MHSQIQTYHWPDQLALQQGFVLKRMEDVYQASHGIPDKPHRHDYFTVIFVKEAKGKHLLDFEEYLLRPNSLYFIFPGQVHQLIADQEPVGWVMNFTRDFLLSQGIPCKIIDDIFLYNDFGKSPPLIPDSAVVSKLEQLMDMMETSIKNYLHYSGDAVGALLRLFLIQSINLCQLNKEDNTQLVDSVNSIARAFRQQLDQNYHHMHQVKDYAQLLAVSADYLNKSIKTITGKSPKQHIQDKIITEAKRLLLFTDLSAKEIAFNLGFGEAAHFSNFFTKHSSLSPAAFRVSARNG